MEATLRKLKNRKSPGLDDIANELLKYGGENLNQQLTTSIRNIVSQHRIPDEWRASITILLFKKGDKQRTENCRGINLLRTALKLTTKIITSVVLNNIAPSKNSAEFCVHFLNDGNVTTPCVFPYAEVTYA